jgi:hypothetical protein
MGAGYFRLNKLNAFNGDYASAEMVKVYDLRRISSPV